MGYKSTRVRQTGGAAAPDPVALATATAARDAAIANDADIAALNLSQTAQDAAIAAAVTQAQLTALQTQVTANVDDSPTGFTSNPDGSVTVSWETQADTTLPAPATVDLSLKADKTDLDAEKTRNDAQDTVIAAVQASVLANTDSITALNLSQTAQDALIAALPTQAQITALQTQITANVDDSPTGFDRNADGSITVTWETAVPSTLPAVPSSATYDDTPLVSRLDALDVSQAQQDAEIVLRELLVNKVVTIRDAATADDVAYPSEKAVRLALDALNFAGDYKGSADTLAGLPAGVNRDWAILTATDGVNLPGIYVTDGAVYTLAKSIPDIAVITEAEAMALSGPDYEKIGLWSSKTLDAYRSVRRSRRLFDVSGSFDFAALPYPDRTAVIVRNVDPANGLTVTYGVGGATSLAITRANGVSDTITGQNTFNIQPSEQAFIEVEAGVVRASVVAAERVSAFETYTDANAFGALPHDGIVVIRSTGQIFARKTGTNNVLFPVDGQPNADWFAVGTAAPSAIANWEPNTAYVTGDKTVIYAPVGVSDPYIAGSPYLAIAKSDRAAVASMVITEWNEWEVSEYKVPGGTARTIDAASAFPYAVSSFTLDDLQTNDWIVTKNATGTAFTWFNTSLAQFNLVDYTGGLVTHSLSGANRTLQFSGAVRFVHTTAGNLQTVVVYPLEPAEVAENAAEFRGVFVLNSGNQYFIPTVTGTYDLLEQRVASTNNELFTIIKRMNTNQTVYTSNGNRITNTNTTNTATVNLIAGQSYQIDPVGGGGTTSGSHKVELTLRP